MNNLCIILFLISPGVFGVENDIKSLARDKFNRFSIELYEHLIKENGNLVYSGSSLSNVLALTSIGAKGDTANQIKTALKFNVSNQQLEEVFKIRVESLKDVERITIANANKVYVADGLAIEQEFLRKASDIFNAGVENLNFNKPKEAAHTINSWVEKETHNKIKNFISEKQLSEYTRLVLVNTLYFSGRWEHRFLKHATEKKVFHNFNAGTAKVDMMKMSANLYIDKDTVSGVSFLKLPYKNSRAEMLIVLPDEIDGFEAVEKKLLSIYDKCNFTLAHVTVSLPKFRVESDIDMIPSLKEMGITNLFEHPDLSGITKAPMVVSMVKQKTFIEVDEVGTEAASATGLEMVYLMETLPAPNAEVFNVDRSFMFTILYDGVSILAGRVKKL